MSIGRNERCPCGSGRKFKHCCIAVGSSVDYLRATASEPPPLDPSRTLASFVDLSNRLRIFVSNDVLLNQLFRDTPRIAADFDEQYADEIRTLNEVVCAHSANLAAAVASMPEEERPREIQGLKMFLLQNASQSGLAALELVRRGFRLEPGILVRANLEQLSVVCHIAINPNDACLLQAGQISSTKTISSAKKVIPPFGQLYGLLSRYFAHVSHLHHDYLNPITTYEAGDEALEMNFRFIRSAVWMQLVVSEFALFDSLSGHRYFRRLTADSLIFAPSEPERAWMTQFLEREKA